MTHQTIDSRRADADRIVARLVQRGVPDQIASVLVPALVSSNGRLRATAEAWISQHAVLGHDLSPEGQALERHTVHAAKRFISEAMERGEFAGEPAFRPGNRYAPSDRDIHAALDQQGSTCRYPGSQQNREALTLSELQARLERKHRTEVHIEDDGRVLDGAGHVVDSVDLPKFGPVPLALRDTSPSLLGADLANVPTRYSRVPDEDIVAYWGDRPFWAEEQ